MFMRIATALIVAELALASSGARADLAPETRVTWSGTFTVPPAASTPLAVGVNWVSAPNTGGIPVALFRITIVNTGANPVYICYGGGACSAANASVLLTQYAGDSPNLGGGLAPTFFSTSGTTLTVRAGD